MSIPAQDLDFVEAALGHRFADRELLVTALTHRSWIEERYPRGEALLHEQECQQRLESLGDAFLGWIVGRWCFEKLPSANESALTEARKVFAKGAWLQQRGTALGIEPYVRRGRGERAKSDTNSVLLEDTLEALLGAIVLDAGEAAAAAVLLSWLPAEPSAAPADPISAVNEWHMARFRTPMPDGTYARAGADHALQWTCTVRAGDLEAEGHGAGKQAARREACARILAQIAGG